MGSCNSVHNKQKFLDYPTSNSIKSKLKNLLSSLEEKTMRVLILLTTLKNSSFHKERLDEEETKKQLEKILEKIDFAAWELNESLDIIHSDIYGLFDDGSPKFRLIRHLISGETYTLFRNNVKLYTNEKESKFKAYNSIFDWIFEKKGLEGKSTAFQRDDRE